MNYLRFLLILVVFSACSEKQNSLDELNLKGKVKEVVHMGYDVVDKYGILEKSNDEYIKYLYSFDENGFLIDKIEQEKNNGRSSLWKYQYNYYDDGRLYKEFINDAMTVYNYENKILKDANTYYANGTLLKKVVYIMSGGKVIREEEYDDKGNLYNFDINNYRGDYWEKEKWTIADGTEELITTESYNNKNLIKRVSHYARQTSEIFYNEENLVVKTINGKWIMDNLMSYREIGNVYEYEYFYDDMGNWIKRIEYKGTAKIPQRIEVRDIFYYDK